MALYKIQTVSGPVYMTAEEKRMQKKLTDELHKYEKAMAKKYGKDFLLLIKAPEYNKIMRLHGKVFAHNSKIMRNQAKYRR